MECVLWQKKINIRHEQDFFFVVQFTILFIFLIDHWRTRTEETLAVIAQFVWWKINNKWRWLRELFGREKYDEVWFCFCCFVFSALMGCVLADCQSRTAKSVCVLCVGVWFVPVWTYRLVTAALSGLVDNLVCVTTSSYFLAQWRLITQRDNSSTTLCPLLRPSALWLSHGWQTA